MAEAQRANRTILMRLAQRIRVPAGFALAPLMLIGAKPSWQSIGIGSAAAVAGLAIRAWASCFIRKNEQLATAGPYAFTRNPLYLGTFLLGVGAAIAAGAVWIVLVFAMFYFLIYVPVMMAEAETMQRLFPDEYQAYSRSVPMFVPCLTPFRADPAHDVAGISSLDPSLYLRHKEYQAALGYLAIVGFLVAKMYLTR